jgi:YVTN family beta-propeller protein
MSFKSLRSAALLALILPGAPVALVAQKSGTSQGPLSPTAVAVVPGSNSLWVACATGRQVMEVNLKSRRVVRAIRVPGDPSGLAIAPDGSRLYVTCAAPASVVAVVDPATGKLVTKIPAGHTTTSPVLSPDGKVLYVANRFNDDVGVIDLEAGKVIRRIGVEREPVSAAVTHDGKLLLVANHLPNGRADVEDVAASVSVVDPHAGHVVKTLRLPNGSGQLNEISVSPDGAYAVVTHLLAHYQVPTSQIERGWMNTNAISVIDISRLEVVNTVLLDGPFNGAANPWGVAWSSDGRQLVVTHAGAHEVSVIDFAELMKKLDGAGSGVPDDLAFLTGLRQVVHLGEGDRGPRAVAIAGGAIYAANYFTDSLSVIELAAPGRLPGSISLGPKQTATVIRKGELYFHDASLCFERWQSCSSCHPGNARVDGLNWDLLNDGIGNPKNTKSLLLAHQTPPAMSLGIRDTAETAVRSGIRYILFTRQLPEVANALDAYLKSLKPVPSPYLANGTLSEAAKRGLALFNRADVGCASCHPSGKFTDLKSYDVGTAGDGKPLDTPTLVEVWRTAPYLHDGSAASMRDLLTTKNARDKHGKTSHLTPQQIEDLAQYVLSL